MEHLTALVEALVAAQVNPPMKEKEMAKVLAETLRSFFHEKMIVNAPSHFYEKVNMGKLLEEDV